MSDHSTTMKIYLTLLLGLAIQMIGVETGYAQVNCNTVSAYASNADGTVREAGSLVASSQAISCGPGTSLGSGDSGLAIAYDLTASTNGANRSGKATFEVIRSSGARTGLTVVASGSDCDVNQGATFTQVSMSNLNYSGNRGVLCRFELSYLDEGNSTVDVSAEFYAVSSSSGQGIDLRSIAIRNGEFERAFVDGITRQTPQAETVPRGTASLVFNVSFSEGVQNVDVKDFSVGGGSTATVTNVSRNSASDYDITVSGGNLASFEGRVGLGYSSSNFTIQDQNGAPIATSYPSNEETYLIEADSTAPLKPGAPDLLASSDNGFSDSDNITNDTTPTVSGTTEAGASIKLFANGTEVGTASADGSGNYTVTPSSAVAPGTVAFTVTATDAGGNVSDVSDPLSVTIDNADFSVTNILRVTPSDENVIVEANSQLVFRMRTDEAVALSTSDVAPGGSAAAGWQISSVTADGGDMTNYLITLGVSDLSIATGRLGLGIAGASAATDRAGNRFSGNYSGSDQAFTIAQDQTPPSKPDAPDLDAGSDNGFSDGDNITNDTTPSFSGTTEANASIKLFADATEVGTTTADSSGNYTVTPSQTVSEGVVAFSVTAIDAAGNVSERSDALSVTIDVTDFRVVNILRLTPDTGSVIVSPGDELVFRMQFDEAVGLTASDISPGGSAAAGWQVVSVTADGGDRTNYLVRMTISSLPEADGRLGLGIAGSSAATDVAGNRFSGTYSGSDEAYTISLDGTAPAKPDAPDLLATSDNGSSDSDNITNDTTPTFSGTTEASASVKLFANGSEVGAAMADGSGGWTITVSNALSDGVQAFTVTATDASSNVSDVSEPLSVTIDTSNFDVINILRENPSTEDVRVMTGDQLVFRMQFSEAVDLSPSDIAPGGSASSGWRISRVDADSGDQANYLVTATISDISRADGRLGLGISGAGSAADRAGNAFSGTYSGSDLAYTVTVDETAPTLTAFSRKSPTDATTAADSLIFDILFSEDVNGVDAADFTISGTTATGSLAGAGAAYTLTVSGGDLTNLNGTVGLDLKTPHGITDEAGNALADGEPATDETYTVANDTTAPDKPGRPDLVAASDTGASATDNLTNLLRPTFSGTAEPNSTVTLFAAASSVGVGVTDGSGNWTITTLTPLPNDTTLAITAEATDAVGNRSDRSDALTVSIDRTAPILSSFARKVPASENTGEDSLVFDITFNEDVSGVAASDFEITGTTATGVLAGSGSDYTLTLSGGDLANLTATVGVNLKVGHGIADLAGNSLPDAEPARDEIYAVFNDVTAPAPPSAPDMASGSDTGFRSDDNLTMDLRPTFTGTAEADVTITLFAGATSIASGDADGSGHWILTPSGDLDEGVFVITATATDAAGNVSNASDPVSIQIDVTPPKVAEVTRADGSLGSTDADVLKFDVRFSENLPDGVLNITDFGVSGSTATVTGFEALPSSTTARVIVSGGNLADLNGRVGLTFPAVGTIVDQAGNDFQGALVPEARNESYSVINDATAPTLAISSGSTDPVSGVFTATFTFSEDVSGFALGDIMVGNGAASGFAVTSASVYTALITPAGDGAVTVDVAADAAEDGAGNGNVAAPQFLITNDETGPTVAITSAAPANVNGRFSVTLTFSEPVVGVGLDDLSLLNARADNLAGSDAVYTLDIIPAASGAVSLTVSAAGAQDRAGNDNSASAALTRQADLDAPTLVLASPAFERVNGPFDVSLTFSEPVTGFAPDDLTLDNASVSGFAGSDADYTLTLTPTRSGEISLSVAAGAAQDIAGNPSIAAPALTRLADLDQPTVVLTRQGAEQGTGAVNGPTTITVTFSEPVSGLGLDDVSVQNGRALNLQGRNERYSFDIVPAGDGAVSVSVGEGAARDRVGNVSAASNTLGFVFDGTAPTLALSSTSPAVVNGRFTLTVRASEAVFGLDAGDISVTNGSVAGLSGSGSTYEALIDPTGSGTVIISIAADAAQDAAGNGSLAPDTLSRSVDQDRPGVTLLSEAPSSVNGPFTVTMQFSEAVTGFAVTDLITTNASLSAFTGSEANYSVLVTANTEGEVSVSIPADVAQDVNGNLNTGSDVLSRTVDLSAPTVTLQTDVTVLTDSTFTLTASFASAVSGLESRDIVTDNAVVTDISGGPVVYVITLSAEQDGEITVSIPENAATDAAGNGNRASGTLTLLRDATGPALSLSTESDEVTGPFTVSFTFDEAVTDFVAADILVENGSLSSLSGSGTGYSAEITPTTVGAVSISVPAGAVEDAFGNGSEAQSLSVTANGGRPVVSLEITANPTNPDETGSRFSLSNPGSDPIFFLASADQPWVDVTPTSGQIGSLSDIEFSVALNERINDLAPGTYVATVTVQVDDGTGASAGKGRPGAPGQETNVTLLAEIPVTVEVEEPLSGLEIVIRTPGGLTGSERLSFASDLDLIDGLDVAANAGDVRLFTSELEAGTYRITQETPDGYRLDAISCAGDLDSGSVIDLTAGTLDIDVDAGETLTCTFSTVRDDAAIRIATQKAIRTFMARRADRVLSAVPDLSNRFTARESTDAGGLSATMNERGKRGAFETNLSGFRNRAAQNAVGDNAGLTKPVLEGWDMWVSAEYAEVDDERNDRGVDGEFFAAQLGFDYQLNPNLILGGLVQYDWMSESDKVLTEGVGATAGAQLSGDGFMVGPYFVWRASDALIIDGLGLWGRTDNRVNPLGFYEDDFETKRFLIQANVTGEIEAGSLRLRPQMTLSHYEDRQDAYIDSLGIDIPSQTVSIGRLRAGPELVWQQRTRTGTLIEWGGSLRAVWDYNGPGRFDDQGRLSGGSEPIRADGTLSLALRLSNGIYLRGEAGLAGLGQGGFEARSGRLELIIPFGKGASSNTSRPGVSGDTNSLIQALTACDTGFGGDSASNIHQTGCPKSDRGDAIMAMVR